MWINFLLQNIHFCLNIFAALVMFGAFWLYFDAWRGHNELRIALRAVGFLLLAISFIIMAGFLESPLLTHSVFSLTTHGNSLFLTKTGGYLALIISLLIDPLQQHPRRAKRRFNILLLSPMAISLVSLSFVLYPILSVATAFLFLRHSTEGLEDHLKPVAYSFYFLALTDLLALRTLFEQTTDSRLYPLFAPFGAVWMCEQLILLIAILILRKWVFGYLLRQIQTQMFMIYTSSIVVIFLITTMTFTGLLLKNIQQETMTQLATDIKVLDYAIKGKLREAVSDAQVVAQTPAIINRIATNTQSDRNEIYQTTQAMLLSKKQSFLDIVNATGQVISRAQDRERTGDSLMTDPLVRRALKGETISSIVTKDGALAPSVLIAAAVPIQLNGTVVGAVLTGSIIDEAFVQGIKHATGLETSIYGNDRISATTISIGSTTQLIGIRETHKAVIDAVLKNGTVYNDSIDVLNTPFFAAYLPLTDSDTNPVGMIFVGKPQLSVLKTAAQSIQMTFVITIILLICSILPAYWIARSIEAQIH